MRSDSVYLDVLTARRLGWTKCSLDFLDLYILDMVIIMIIRIYNHFSTLYIPKMFTICVCILLELMIYETLCAAYLCRRFGDVTTSCKSTGSKLGIMERDMGNATNLWWEYNSGVNSYNYLLSVSCLPFVVISLRSSSLRCFYLPGTAHYKSCCCSVR